MTHLEIEAFLAICRQKNISRAAAELYISQPSLSTRLKTLEREVGCTLFLRHKGGHEITLTPEGERFHALALQHQDLRDRMLAVGKTASRIRVSSLNSVGSYLLPPVYARFMAEYPHIQLEIQDMEEEMACRKLLQRATDIAFTSERQDSSQILSTPVLSEPMVFICAAEASYPQTVQLEDLQKKDEIYIEWSLDFARWHQAAFGEESAPQLRLEIMSQLQFFVSKNNSWAIVPRSVAEGIGTNGIRQCSMSFQPPHRIVYALQPKTAVPNKSIPLFWECVRREFAHWTPFGSILLPEAQN